MSAEPTPRAVRFQSDDEDDIERPERTRSPRRPSAHALDPNDFPRPLPTDGDMQDEMLPYPDSATMAAIVNQISANGLTRSQRSSGGGGMMNNGDVDPYAAAAPSAGSRPTRPMGPIRTPSNTYAPARRPTGGGGGSAGGVPSSTLNESVRSASKNRPRVGDNSRFKAQEQAYVRRLRENPSSDYFDYPNGDSDSEGETPSSETHFDERYNQEVTMFYGKFYENDEMQPTEEDIRDPQNRERLEWHGMLESVLLGDVVRQEKKRIIGSSEANMSQASQKLELWLGIRARVCGRLLAIQRRMVDDSRAGLDQLLDEITNFEIKGATEAGKGPYEQVKDAIQKLDKCEHMYPSWAVLASRHKAAESPMFWEAYTAIVSWYNANELITTQLEILKKWVGNEDLDLTRANESSPTGDGRTRQVSFLDRLTGDKDGLQSLFQQEKEDQERARRRDLDQNRLDAFGRGGGGAGGGRVNLLTLKDSGESSSHNEKGMLIPLMRVVAKVKETMIANHEGFKKRHLPQHLEELLTLVSFPSRLIEEVIKLALVNARRVKDSTQGSAMMQNQMTDQFQLLLRLAVRIKQELKGVVQPEPGWELPSVVDEDHDQVVLEALRFYFKMLNWKLSSNKNTFKEAELLFQEWEFANSIGAHLQGGDIEVAEQFSSLTFKALNRLNSKFEEELQLDTKESGAELTKRYKQLLDSVRVRQRMLQRFSRMLSTNYENACDFSISLPAVELHMLYNKLLETGHVQIPWGGEEGVDDGGQQQQQQRQQQRQQQQQQQDGEGSGEAATMMTTTTATTKSKKATGEGVYVFASYTLRNRPQDIKALLAITSVEQIAEDGNEEEGTPYLLLIRPETPPEWFGEQVSVPGLRNPPANDMKRGQLRLCAISSRKLEETRRVFLGTIGMHLDLVMEQRSNLSKVNTRLTETRRMAYLLTRTYIDSVEIVRKQTQDKGCQELVQACFVSATEFGQRSLAVMDSNRRQMNKLMLTKLALDWIGFICEDCVASDRITFRWAVLALEFAMIMTRGRHILALGDAEYDRLRVNVSGCMRLLISHFDIMGARSAKADQLERQRQEGLQSQLKKFDHNRLLSDDEAINSTTERRLEVLDDLDGYRHDVQNQVYPLGTVLKANNEAERSLAYLSAAATTMVTMRWQQGACVGGGTFGQVYSAVNLETGQLMAVKEIRLQDPKLIPGIAESIRDEMNVLSVLDHPNVVEYYGIEVHRDKVCIFMEYCAGGSLAGLLEHGRIEDEQVTMVYALQLLEGLAYLHGRGIIHRDIKPENILLDQSGVIKYVDFGAAKVIARQGRTIATGGGGGGGGGGRGNRSITGTPMYMSPEAINGTRIAWPGAVDVWSLGCVILEMVTGRRPWSHLDNEFAVMYSIAQGNLPQMPTPDQLSAEGVDLLRRCLVQDAEKRATAVELLHHEWIRAIRSEMARVEPLTPSDVSSESAQSTPLLAFEASGNGA